MKHKGTVFVGMSGGVDSSVSALLLKQQGFDVVGVFMKNWTQNIEESVWCTWEEDQRFARQAAEQIGIPLYTWDFEKEYRKLVFDYFLREYKNGNTPNPDVMCNKEIKFGLFLKKALSMGADYIATGHYVRIAADAAKRTDYSLAPAARDGLCSPGQNSADGGSRAFAQSENSFSQYQPLPHTKQSPFAIDKKDEGDVFMKSFRSPGELGPQGGRQGENADNRESQEFPNYRFAEKYPHHLLIAKDLNKDQSYFLWTLTQEQLKYCLFPVGNLTKPEVRAIAAKYGLVNAGRKDSQGLCFVGRVKFKNFLSHYLPEHTGKIIEVSFAKQGKRLEHEIGEHQGMQFFTIGQRQGIGIGGGEPFMVIAKDAKTNTLYVSREQLAKKFFSKDIDAFDANWIESVSFPLSCMARHRYRQALRPVIVERTGEKTLRVHFKTVPTGIASGQSIVLYKNKKMLGGAVIA